MMNRPPLEVADLVRAAGRTFIEHSRKWITGQHLKVLRAIARCRTAALGGHIDECTGCEYRPPIPYNSCRNRHCPKCQANARDRWLQARRQELLLTRYVHVVFTLPHELAPLALQNKKVLYHLLLQTSAETLLEVARDPQHLGAEIGFFSVLHTWNQKLEHHPHAHCVVPAGGLSLDHSRWVPSHSRFFLPIPVLRKVFRRKFVSALKHNFRQDKIGFHGTLKPLAHPKAFSAWLRTLYRHQWHVYSKRPFGGAEQALRYLGRYTHRVAISNHAIRKSGAAVLLLVKLLIDHLSVVGKRGLIFRILSEVGVFLHVNLADGILYLHARPVERTNLSKEIIEIVAKALQFDLRRELKMARYHLVQGKGQRLIERFDPVFYAALVHRGRRPVQE